MATPRKRKEGTGRPSKLSPEISKEFCECVELGMAYQHSCDYVGISYQTFLNWKQKGEGIIEAKHPSKYTKQEAAYVQFFVDVKKAESKGIRNNLDNIKKAATGDMDNKPQWQAGAWILERRHPDQFAKHEKIDQKTEHSGGVSIKLQMTDCSKKGD